MNFGIIRGEPIALYHQSEAVSSTRLMDLRPCPLFYKMRHVDGTIPREDKACFDVGNAAHWLILEGRGVLNERTVLQPATYPVQGKDGAYTGERKPWTYAANVCKEWRMAQNGKVILTAADFALVDRMAAAVAENPDAVVLLSGGESEVTFRVQHPAFAVQCRADHWHADGPTPVSVDLKTCDTIEQFRRDYFKCRYYYRAAFYEEVIKNVVGVTPQVIFVAVEKEAPWRCEVFAPADADLALGYDEMLADLQTLRRCVETGIWPGAKSGVQQIELSSWQRKIAADYGAGLYAEETA